MFTKLYVLATTPQAVLPNKQCIPTDERALGGMNKLIDFVSGTTGSLLLRLTPAMALVLALVAIFHMLRKGDAISAITRVLLVLAVPIIVIVGLIIYSGVLGASKDFC